MTVGTSFCGVSSMGRDSHLLPAAVFLSVYDFNLKTFKFHKPEAK